MDHNGNFCYQSSHTIFTNLKNDFELERWLFMDLRLDSHASATEA
jgi:hypothetical protein